MATTEVKVPDIGNYSNIPVIEVLVKAGDSSCGCVLDGDVVYHMGIKDGKSFCAIGPLDGADLTITQTYETAVSIAKGELNLQNAFMQGQIQVAGNIAIAMQNAALCRLISIAARSRQTRHFIRPRSPASARSRRRLRSRRRRSPARPRG